MPISNAQYLEMLRRTEGSKLREGPAPDDAVEEESGLHSKILKWGAQNHVAMAHSRMDKKSRMKAGVPDFIFPYNGRVFFIECKTRTGKRSTPQLIWALLAEKHGARVDVVRSMEEFWAIVEHGVNPPVSIS